MLRECTRNNLANWVEEWRAASQEQVPRRLGPAPPVFCYILYASDAVCLTQEDGNGSMVYMGATNEVTVPPTSPFKSFGQTDAEPIERAWAMMSCGRNIKEMGPGVRYSIENQISAWLNAQSLECDELGKMHFGGSKIRCVMRKFGSTTCIQRHERLLEKID
ncbi:hypothetical protein B0H10DRAFT_1970762 [Mycena sp. CBHHK59/15]|nr:hypothetical protein B0H10DRAFT_1970762 [Mycena sp. CBHHK59/15]